jgi:thioredoxin-like negative regulator of GroEL
MAAPAKPARPSSGASAGTSDPAFASALALYKAGQYAEALPRFNALRANNPEADLYAARCVLHTSGCAAAAPRFDAVAQRNKGTAVGSRAQLEGGSCYQQMNNVQAARSRYQAAKDEGSFASEASRDLDALDGNVGAGQASPAATTGPGAAGGSKATPKAPAPPPAVEPTEAK